jgi:PAS domain S-box-containing protein
MNCEVLENTIRELKQENLELRNKLEFHELFEEFSNSWETFRNENGKLIYVSPSVKQITGYTKDEFLEGKIAFINFVHPDDLELAKFNYQEQLRRCEFSNLVCRIFTKDNTLKYLSISSRVVYNQNGDYLGFRTSCIDISEIKRVSDSLKNSEDKYRTLLEKSSDPFFSFTPEGQYTYVNTAFAAGVGKSIDDIIGKKIWDVFPKEEADKRFAPLSEVFRTGIEKAIEVRVPRNDGDRYYITTIIPVKDSLGITISVICSSKDISERKKAEQALKESEESYKKIIENLTDMYYRADVDGKIILLSPSVLDIFGLSSMEEVYGRTIDSLYKNPEERDEFVALLKSTGKVRNFRATLIKNDGTEVFVETTANILLDNQGKYAGVEGISRDITERIKVEQTLKENELRLKELNATKDKLFSIMAHDLRSPFNGILGFSDLLNKNIRNIPLEDAENYLLQINITAKHTLNLLENLLQWAKTQTGQIIYKPESLRIQPIIKKNVAVFDSSAKIKNITLKVSKIDDISVYADSNMLNAILRNLISNAIKFTNTGGEIDLKVSSNQDIVEISVKDNGVGMSDNFKNSLFDMNSNTSMRGTNDEKGTGLGLVLCKDFVEKHGGRIWVESKPDLGSEFKFTLKLSNS